jgi:hypothetical protein
MNTTVAETTERPVNVEEQARIVMGLLREYAGKLSELTAELLQLPGPYDLDFNRVAWLLDQSELLRKPLLTILSRGSGLRENAPLEPIVRDELSLRMFETEVHLHHVTRLTILLRDRLSERQMAEQVAKLRVSAGLPGESNGTPLPKAR